MGGAAPPEKHQRGCPADRCVAWCTHPCPTPTTALHCRRALHEPPCTHPCPSAPHFSPGKGNTVQWPMQRAPWAHAAHCDGLCSALRHLSRHSSPSAAPRFPFHPLPQKRKVLRDDNHHAALYAPQERRPGSIPPGSPCTSWESCPSWHGTPCRGGHGTRSRTPRRWPRCCNGDSR